MSDGATDMLTLARASAFAQRPLTKDDLLQVLANHEQYGLAPQTWLALDARQALVDASPEATLAGRVGVTAEALNELTSELGLFGGKTASLCRLLQRHRTGGCPLVLTVERIRAGSHTAR